MVGRLPAALAAASLLLGTACSASAAEEHAFGTDNAAPLRSSSLGTPVAVPAATRSDGPILVSLGDNYFSPPLVTVKVGQTVIWHNFGQQSHDVRSRDGSVVSPLLPPGGVYTLTFARAGKFKFYCTLHSGEMIGEVDVE